MTDIDKIIEILREELSAPTDFGSVEIFGEEECASRIASMYKGVKPINEAKQQDLKFVEDLYKDGFLSPNGREYWIKKINNE